MFDPLLFALSLLHLAALLALGFYGARFLKLPRGEAPLFAGLLIWIALVLGAQGASLCGALGSLAVYLPMTLAGVAAALLTFRAAAAHRAAPLFSAPALPFTEIESPRRRRLLFWFLATTLTLFALISLILGLSVYPDNADSMIYRLPRAFWYVSQGSFLHPFESIDQRLVFYPLSGVALYVPFVLYALPGTAHALPSLLSWAAIVYLAYRFAREIGAGKLIALAAAWLIALTPGILAQATSTNDEIIAAAALLTGFYMLWRWAHTGSGLYFLFSGCAVALSASTKLHIVFLLPVLAALALYALWRLRATPQIWAQIWAATGWRTLALTAAAMAVLFTPFLFYNYASTGRFYFLNDFQSDVFNLGANIRISLQNLMIYFSQMIFSPLGDLNVWPDANVRLAFNAKLNALLGEPIKSILSPEDSFYHLGYRFQGITLPVSIRFVEFSLWSGFVWLLWPLQATLAARMPRFALRVLFAVIALIPLIWLLLWSCTTLYMEGTATYYTFYLICAAPAAAFAFAPIAHRLRDHLRWIIIGLVMTTNLVIAHNLVMYSGFRALPDLYYARSWPYDWLLTEKPIVDELRGASRIRIAFTHEKMPYFGYMHWNPRAEYLTPYQVPPEKMPHDPDSILQILPISSLTMYGYMPIKVPGKATSGVTYLGAVRAIGREAVFAAGAGVQNRHPQESDYIIGRLQLPPAPDEKGRYTVIYSDDVAGLNAADHLTFEHALHTADGQIFFHRAPAPAPAFETSLPMNPATSETALYITTIVRDAATGQERTRVTYQIGRQGAWLPDPGDY